jgi:hypothetical protein
MEVCHRRFLDQLQVAAQELPAALLGRVLGIYVGWAEEPPPADITRWKLKEFHISKSARRGDSMAVHSIWQAIEEATAVLTKKH